MQFLKGRNSFGWVHAMAHESPAGKDDPVSLHAATTSASGSGRRNSCCPSMDDKSYGSSHRVADGGNMLDENQCDYTAPEPAAGHPRSQRTGPNGGISDYIDVLGGDLEVVAHRRM